MSQQLSLITIALLAGVSATRSAIYQFNLTSHDASARCLDGTSPLLWLHKGDQTNRSWIVSLQGGGFCYTPTDCAQRALTPRGSSSSAAGSDGLFTGALSTNCTLNPDYCGYNIAVLQYCDGLVFSGDRDQPLVVDGRPLYFRGRRILSAALSMLLQEQGLDSATQMMLAGESAGAVSAVVHADSIYNTVRAAATQLAQFGVLALSGFMPNTIPNLDGDFVYGEQLQSAFELHSSSHGVNQACIAARPESAAWECGTTSGVLPYLEAPVFLVNSVYDAWGTACILGAAAVPVSSGSNGNCSAYEDWADCLGSGHDTNHDQPGFLRDLAIRSPASCTQDQIHKLNTLWRQPLVAELESTNVLSKRGNGAFLHTCYTHCAATMDGSQGGIFPDGYHTFAIDGVSIQQAVRQWWSGKMNATATENVHLPCSWREGRATTQCNPTCSPL